VFESPGIGSDDQVRFVVLAFGKVVEIDHDCYDYVMGKKSIWISLDLSLMEMVHGARRYPAFQGLVNEMVESKASCEFQLNHSLQLRQSS
jgi:hypothetical protein